MFKKLRNKLILINLGITTVVILMVFSMIYVVATRNADSRPPKIDGMVIQNEEIEYGEDVENIIMFTIREEKQAAAKDLLVTLIVSGIAIEVAVAIISYAMAEQAIRPVKEAYNSQKVFIANASHEIKTPLAAIAANLEAADIHNNKWISNVEHETEKLAALNAELLALARTDLVTETTAEEVDLKNIVMKTLESFEPRLKKKTLKKTLNLPGKLKINASDFAQILTILMDNAVKYSQQEIVVDLHPHTLTVANDGAKIEQDKLSHIFERFYQADKTAEGVGLGLSIAKSLAERNGWKLTAASGGMTTFTLQF